MYLSPFQSYVGLKKHVVVNIFETDSTYKTGREREALERAK